MKQFSDWLSLTGPSVFLQDNNRWAIPTIQSLHIMGIALVIGSALLISLRILGRAGIDQTLPQTMNRYFPWLTGSLWLLLLTGLLLVIAEPVRELVSFSFWAKMFLVAVMAVLASIFQNTLRKHEAQWGETLIKRRSTRWVAILTFVIWAGIIVLGRLIAYDHVWGFLSPKA